MTVTDEIRKTCLSYIGRQRRAVDTMAPEPAGRLAVLLEADPPVVLPPTWHWAYFTTALRADETGHDGHEKLGLFMPPAPFARRMWAAGKISVQQPLRLGIPAERVSTIADVAFKEGRSGPLCFVEIEHAITQEGALALRETQTVVYRDRGLAEQALRGPNDPIPEGNRVFPDTLLIAYSAILQNGHRIHWDRDFCRDEEGYPGLVVHGPLLATVLAGALIDAPRTCDFSYRAMAPVFETSPVRVERDGNGARIMRSDDVVAMEASVT